MTQEAEPLFVQYLDTEPIQVDPEGCKDVADLIEKAQQKFKSLHSFSLCDITLHRYSGIKLKGDMKISELLRPPFQNDDDTPLLIKTRQSESERFGTLVLILEPADEPKFIKFLNRGNINNPNSEVLITIANRFPNELFAALAIGTSACVDLYNTVKALPTKYTLGVIQNQLKISIKGPMSLAQPNILIAVDLDRGKHLFIKLLRIPEATFLQSILKEENVVETEANTCVTLSEANIIGLVKCDVVKVTVKHSEDLNIVPEVWAVLKMKRYVSSLTDIPQLTEKWLYCGFSRVLKALKEMHKLNLVHMDVKLDNLFVDQDLNWDLGDFGSARKIGALIWSFTEVLNPYTIPLNATAIPAMDFVLLCVVIAIELNKKEWMLLRGQHQNVQEQLILEKLNSIKDDAFKREVVELFEQNFKIVQEHFLQLSEFY